MSLYTVTYDAPYSDKRFVLASNSEICVKAMRKRKLIMHCILSALSLLILISVFVTMRSFWAGPDWLLICLAVIFYMFQAFAGLDTVEHARLALRIRKANVVEAQA